LPNDEAAARPLTSRSNKTVEIQAGETISAISSSGRRRRHVLTAAVMDSLLIPWAPHDRPSPNSTSTSAGDRYLLALSCVLLGYAVMGKGFAYFRLSAVFRR